jgi:hypothetical protein
VNSAKSSAKRQRSQVCLSITGGSLDEGGSSSAVLGNDNLVTDVEGQDVVVFREGLNCLEIRILQVGRPGEGL